MKVNRSTYGMADNSNLVKPADFGIARIVDDISGFTTTNMTVGTVAYSAPEQLMGEEIDGRAESGVFLGYNTTFTFFAMK